MGKKRERIQNPQPFLSDNSSVVSKNRTKASKRHQHEEKMISEGISSKILKEALIQQREIQDEQDERVNPAHSAFAAAVADEPPSYNVEEDVDEFSGFSETEIQFGDFDEVNEEEERLLEAFLSSDTKQRTLADVIAERIRENDAAASAEARPQPRLDNQIMEIYKGVGKALSVYTVGKLPKALKHIPSMNQWEEVLYLTEPEKWSPNAVYQATRIFASNFGVAKATRFYKLVLLPRVREDIRKNKRLHFALFQSLKKALYKPAAFNKGILFPLCESGSFNLREAVIIGSVISNVSIPPLHSSVALLKLAEMNYCGTTSYIIKLLIEKKYALPYRVLDGLVAHFMRFLEDSRTMPVIWHQSLLAFVQRYKNELRKEDKDALNFLMQKQKHRLVTPEVLRELNNSRNRGEKEDSLQTSPTSVIIKPIEEDRFDIPEVPMEED